MGSLNICQYHKESKKQQHTFTAVNAPTRFIQAGKNKIAYRTIGKGKPLLLCNRLRGILDTWDPLFLDLLARNNRVIIFDYPGIGLSSGQLAPTMEGVARDVKDFALALKLNKFRLIGWSYGGGWILSDFPTHKRMVRDLVVRSGMAAVFINYTRTPEAKYPQALNECYATTKWVAEHDSEIGVDGKNLAIVGNSAGGNLATATALMAKDKNGPKIKLQILMWPTIDTDYSRESYLQFATDRFLTASVMKFMYDLYSTDPKQRQEIYFSPLKASTQELKGMPPTLIQVAENDILRDEGEAYGRKLDAAGVNVTTLRYDGMIHDFGLLNGLSGLSQTRALFDHAALALKQYLKNAKK